MTVKDAWGDSVTLGAPPHAIVSLTLATDEMLVELVDKARIKAIDVFAADPGISNIADFARTFPTKISGEKEVILSLQPDLVLVASWKEKSFVQTLRDAGLRVFVVQAPATFDELRHTIAQVSALVGERGRGQELIGAIDQKLAFVAAKVAAVPAARRPTILAYSFSGTTAGLGTSFDALATQAGLINAAAQAGIRGWPQISKEQILQIDPDLIALPSWSFDGTSDPVRSLAALMNDPVFSGLKAVRNKHVVIFQDRHIDSGSQYMADGVEDLAKAAWPGLFP